MLQSIPIDSINVKDRIRKDLGNIPSLAENIREIGLLNPILVNEHYQLLAGERRLTACKSLGWEEVPAIIMDTADAERELAVEFAENRYRKDFNREEIVDTGIRLERILSVKAQDRIKAGKSDPSQNSDEGSGRTDDAVSNNLGISRDTYRKMKYIVDNRSVLPEGDYLNWNTGVISTNKAYGLIKKELEPKLPVPKVPKDESLEVVQKQLADAILKIADLQDENDQLKTDISTFNNAAYMERNKKSVYAATGDTDQIYDLGFKVRNMLEEDLAPLKFRRCFQRVQVSETARENLRDLIDAVQGWTSEMEMLLNGNTNIIDME